MKKRPLSGAIIGILIGVAMAVILARLGIWPPDQLTVFLLSGVIGLLGLLLLSVGRENSVATMVIAVLILLPMGVWGALGFGEINQTGELNGGCTVDATSSEDTTTVTDSSRTDPFVIDPDGSLTWSAISPQAFMDYEWRLDVVVGGIPVPIESGEEANEAGDTENAGDVPDVDTYASARGIDLDLYVGVYEVGGSAATCDGFGFVELTGDGVDLVMIGAIVLIILLIILLLILFYTGRSQVVVESTEVLGGAAAADSTGATGSPERGFEPPVEGRDQG